MFAVKPNSNKESELTISNVLSLYIVYTRKLITNSVEQLNNILTNPDNFDSNQLTTANLTNT